MGQITLGLRSLAIKLAVFFVMAMLLAWALGGTLWPRTEQIDGEAVSWQGRQWYWQLIVEGRRDERRHGWRLMASKAEDEPETVDERLWLETAGPVATGEGLYVGGCLEDQRWRIQLYRDDSGPLDHPEDHPMPDRLAVERQLARVAAGLSLEDQQTILRQRDTVLDPGPDSAPSTE